MYKCYEEKGSRTGALENGRAVVAVLTSGGQGGPLWEGFISADRWMREGGEPSKYLRREKSREKQEG